MKRLPALAGDERGLIVGWIGKIVIGLALTAVVIYDAGSILINFFTLDSKAEEIAITLTVNNASSKFDVQTLQAEASALASEAEARLLKLEVDPVGRIVKVTLRRRADTLVVGRISVIEDWARATAEGQSGIG